MGYLCACVFVCVWRVSYWPGIHRVGWADGEGPGLFMFLCDSIGV